MSAGTKSHRQMQSFNEETKRLTELYGENRDLLQGTDKKGGTEAPRRNKWEESTEILNSESGKNFSVDSVKKRWQNIKSDAKDIHQVVTKIRWNWWWNAIT